MPNFFEGFSTFKKTPEKQIAEQTPTRLTKYGELIIKTLCKNYNVAGENNFKDFKNSHPEAKFIITGSHMNNLDVPAALVTFGKNEGVNLQITGNELFSQKLEYTAQNIGVKTLFQDRFTPLGQKMDKVTEEENGKTIKKKIESGIFRPENFEELDTQINNGRTPWMAAHSFSMDGKMRKVDNGAVVEAYRQDTWLVPTALELNSGSKSMQGVAEIAKNLKDSSATYHIGQPYKPKPLPAGLDINILTDVIKKRAAGEEVSDEEFEAFKMVNHFLSEQTEILGRTIADLLPEEQRGYYAENKNEESV